MHTNIWKGKPHPFIVENIDNFTDGEVLVLGGNIGRNAIYLAKNGHKVINIDIDDLAITQFTKLSKKLELETEGIVDDIYNFPLENEFSNILTAFTLHFDTKEKGLKLITNMKKATKPSGTNTIIGFTYNGDFNINPKINTRLYFGPKQLQDIYSDWEVVGHKLALSRTKKGGHQQATHIIARKTA